MYDELRYFVYALLIISMHRYPYKHTAIQKRTEKTHENHAATDCP